MATQVQFRRGNTTQHSTFTGASGEVTVDIDKKVVVIHDGSTAGGSPVAKELIANLAFDKANTVSTAFAKANTANTTADLSFSHANAAFDKANTRASNTNSNIFIGGQRATINTVPSVSNVFTPSFSTNNFFTVSLANNETLANATADSSTIGQSGAIFVIQSSAGSKTLSFGLAYKFPANSPPTITTTANAVDMVVYTVRKANSFICDIVQDVGNFNDT